MSGPRKQTQVKVTPLLSQFPSYTNWGLSIQRRAKILHNRAISDRIGYAIKNQGDGREGTDVDRYSNDLLKGMIGDKLDTNGAILGEANPLIQFGVTVRLKFYLGDIKKLQENQYVERLINLQIYM